jgi:hypothetical protein
MTIESAGSAPAQPDAPAAPAKNVFQRMVGVFFAPEETFGDIARRPDILWPMLILVVIGYATTLLMVPRMDFDAIFAQQAEQMKKQQPDMSEADIERVGRFSKATTKVGFYVAPLLTLGMYALMALVLWGAVRLMGGDGDFKQSLSATLYAWMPLVLFSIILTIVVVARGSIEPTEMQTVVKSNPAFLVDGKEQPVLASFLSNFDIFTIWTVVLLVFGFSALSRMSKAKTAAIIVSLWMVVVVVKLGFAALTAAQMKG